MKSVLYISLFLATIIVSSIASSIETLWNTVQTETITKSFLESSADSLKSLVGSGEILSKTDSETVHLIVNFTINQALSLGGENFYPSLVSLLDSLDNSIVPETSNIIDILGQFSELVGNTLTSGQNPVDLIYKNFRIKVQKNVASSTSLIDIPGALTNEELQSGKSSTFVQVQSSGDGDVLSTAMISVNAALFATAQVKLESNPLQFRLSPLKDIKTLYFTLVNNMPVERFSDKYVEDSFNYACVDNVVETLSYTCGESGRVVTAECSGIAGSGQIGCPRPAPQCSVLNPTTQLATDSDCKVIGFTSDYTTCECDVSTSSGGGVMGSNGVVTLTTTNTFIATSKADTFVTKSSNTDSNSNSMDKVNLITIVVCVVGGFVLLCALIGRFCFNQSDTSAVVDSAKKHSASDQHDVELAGLEPVKVNAIGSVVFVENNNSI